MRVQIYPHDTTDSIVTTVKNFYGIYDKQASGVSFEDENGITLIARYENLRNNMTVYVRVIPAQAYGEGYSERFYGSYPIEARKRPSLGEPFQMPAMPSTHVDHAQPPSRPTSRLARKRSTSPSSRSRRSASQNKHSKAGAKSRNPTNGVQDDYDDDNTDSEDGYGSANGTKKEIFASSDISMENILHDGRRKRPKFDSSVGFMAIFSSSIASSNHTYIIGIALVRSPSGASNYIYLLDLTAASVDRPRGSWFALRSSHPAALDIPTLAIATELWP